MMRYAVLFEKTATGYSAHVPTFQDASPPALQRKKLPN
jgi:predicted RNase H-like HicB family nuclease